MVASIIRQVWRCPECSQEWGDVLTPRFAQVFHRHDGREVQMVWQREDCGDRQTSNQPTTTARSDQP